VQRAVPHHALVPKRRSDALNSRPGRAEAPVNPDTLCPFCDQPLPDNPSEDLLRKKDALLNDPSARRKRTMQNSKAVRLRDGHVVRTAEFCKQHRDERIFIPEGRAQGWPAEIDWAALPGLVFNCRNKAISLHPLTCLSRAGGSRGCSVSISTTSCSAKSRLPSSNGLTATLRA
jgi:hypothetical protein